MAAAVAPLGVGAVYWPPLHAMFAGHPDIIEVAEIEPSSFWLKKLGADGALKSNLLELERVASLPQAKLLHGVGYPVGGTVCDHGGNVEEQRRWADRLDPAWTSEHLSFNETSAGAAGFLLPPCQSPDGVAVAAANIRARAAALGRPFAFETGVSYLPPRPGEMEDGDFFAAVAEAADCHILLDLHNLWANERNGRARVTDVLRALPLDRVCEVHLAGGQEKDGYWLDAHSGLVPPALFDLAAEIMPQLPAVGAIIFEVAPEHLRKIDPAEIFRQVEALHRLWERRGRAPAPSRSEPLPTIDVDGLSAAAWEHELLTALGCADCGENRRAIALYRSLIGSFRNGALAAMLTRSLRLLQLTHGEERIEELLADYAEATSPQLYPTDEAMQFAEWLKPRVPETPYLEDMLAFEAGIVKAVCSDGSRDIRCRHDPSLIVAAVAEGRLPENLEQGDYRFTLGP